MGEFTLPPLRPVQPSEDENDGDDGDDSEAERPRESSCLFAQRPLSKINNVSAKSKKDEKKKNQELPSTTSTCKPPSKRNH